MIQPLKTSRVLVACLLGLATNAFADTNCVPPAIGLTIWLPFDGNALDEINGGLATLNGSPAFSSGKVAQGLQFDGVDDAVRLSASPTLDVGAGSGATIELWIKPQQVSSPAAVLEWSAVSGSQLGLHLFTGNGGFGTLYANLVDTAGTAHTISSPGGVVSSGVLQHIALTYSRASGSAGLYVNGVLVAQANFGDIRLETRTDLWLGQRVLGGTPYRFSGVMDEVSIYNRTLSQTELQAIYAAGADGKCKVPQPPHISSQPTGRTVLVGQSVSFSVVAASSLPISYQWVFGGQSVNAATNATFAIPSVATNDTGDYSVIVQNSVGSVTSAVAVLTVNLPPPCLLPPSGLAAWWPLEGSGADLVGAGSIAFTGNPAFAPGKVGTALVLDGVDDTATVPASPQLNIGAADGFTIEGWINPVTGGQQPLVEWNSSPGTAGAHFWLGQNPPLGTGNGSLYANLIDIFGVSHRITTPGGLVVAGEWQHVALTCTRSNGLTTIYLNGSQVAQQILGSFSAQTAPPYNLLLGHRVTSGSVQFRYTGKLDEISLYGRALSSVEIHSIFDATVSGKCNAGFPAQIIAGPQSRTVTRGSNVTFTVSASGTAPLAYQWRFNSAGIPDATNATLTLSNVQINQSGNYSVTVTNSLDQATSSNAVLVVNPPIATVRVVSANGAAGAEVSVPVELFANGNENALGLSLVFNSTVLGYSSAVVGVGTPAGTTLFVNTNDASLGRIGVVVGLPADAVFPEGTQQVALVTFLVAPLLNPTNVALNIGDVPTLRQLSDVHARVLPAVFVGGVVSIAQSEFEADVAPRPDGNRSVATVDWVQMGRFVARLDTISTSNEFQRADCAPRATKGNGILAASDWVQAGRYAVGLDPLTILGGPTEPDIGGGGAFIPSSAGTKLSLSSCNIAQGLTNVVPVMAECQGGENAMTFSVMFDSSKLALISATLGADAGGATLNPNTSQAAAGILGLALALQPGASFAAGSRELVLLRYQALAAAPTSSAVAFTNAPVPIEVSDVRANPMAITYIAATVTIVPPPGPPIVASRLGETLYLTWPTSATGFELQGSAGALGTIWTTIPAVTIGDLKLAIVPTTGVQRFFRLRKP